MNKKGYSYFSRHQKITKSKYESKDPVPPSPPPSQKQINMIQSFGMPVQQSPPQQITEEQLDLPYSEKTEQQIMYEEFKEIQRKYDQELKDLQTQIDRLKNLADLQVKKVRQAQVGLEGKKKQLKQAQNKHKQLQKVAQTEGRLEQNNKIKELQKALDILKQSNRQKIVELTEEYDQIVNENKQVENKMILIEAQYKKVLQFDPEDYETQKTRLIQEQQTLKKELQEMEKDGERITRDIQKIQTMKPVSAQVHRKYLDLYEKIFISKEITKAEQIMILKEEQKRQKRECETRKEWMKEKENEIKIRQKRITSKNQLIESLTNQIKNKSTTLLNMYQTQQQKFKK